MAAVCLAFGFLTPVPAEASRVERLLEKGDCAGAAASTPPGDAAGQRALANCYIRTSAWVDLAKMGAPGPHQRTALDAARVMARLARGSDLGEWDPADWPHPALAPALGWSTDRVNATTEASAAWVSIAAGACLPNAELPLDSWRSSLGACFEAHVPETVRQREAAIIATREEAARQQALAKERARPMDITVGGGTIGAFAVSPEGGQLAFTHENATDCDNHASGQEYLLVKVVDLEAPDLKPRLLGELPVGACTDFLVWSGDGQRLAVGWGNHPKTTAALFDVETGSQVARVEAGRVALPSRDGTSLQHVTQKSTGGSRLSPKLTTVTLKRWRFEDGKAAPTVTTRIDRVEGDFIHLRREAAELVHVVKGTYDPRTDAQGELQVHRWDLETGTKVATTHLPEAWDSSDLLSLFDEFKATTGPAFVVGKATRMAGYPPLEGADPGLDGTSQASIAQSFAGARQRVSQQAFAGLELDRWCSGKLRLPANLPLKAHTHGPLAGTGFGGIADLDQRQVSDDRIVATLRPLPSRGSRSSSNPATQLWLIERDSTGACSTRKLPGPERGGMVWWDATQSYVAVSVDIVGSKDWRHRQIRMQRLPASP
jgi:hypothetical protein